MTTHFSGQAFVSLKLVSFSEVDRVKFESILAIAERGLDVSWQVVDSATADFYLLNSQTNLDNLLQSLPRERCIFCTVNATDSNDNELVITDSDIPSLSSLLSLFNRLATTLAIPHASDPASIEPPLTTTEHNPEFISEESPIIHNEDNSLNADTEYFDPEQGFVGALLSGKEGIQCLSLKNGIDINKLYIYPEEKTYYSKNKLELLTPFFFSSSESLLFQPLSEIELQKEIVANELKSQPLSKLVWCAVFNCSQGRSIKGYNKNDVIRLKRWPDINFPGCRELIQLAAYMQSNAVTLNTVQKQTGFPLEQIYNFYNACKAIDLIEHSQQIDTHEKKLNDDKRQLFAKIGDRLNKFN